MNRQASRLLVTLCVLLLCMATLTGFAQEDIPVTPEARVVKVGFPIQGGISQKDEQGNYSGYTYDYLQEIAQYTGWEYEFVEVPSESNQDILSLLDMLEKGEIDLMGGMVKNETSTQQFDFPEHSYGITYTTLVVPEQNTHINENNYHTIEGLRIALSSRSVLVRSKLVAFCELNNIDYKLVECESGAAMQAAVQEGFADVMVSSDLTPIEGMRTVAHFNGSQFYFATTKGNPQILNELNRTILTIQQIKPFFTSTLYNKYFSNQSYITYLSESELEYVDYAPVLRVAMVQEIEPIQYMDRSGQLRGIAPDLLDRVRQLSGLKFEYLPATSYADALQMLAAQEADAICGVPYDYSMAQENNFILSSTFLSAQSVLVVPKGSSDNITGKSVGVIDRRQPELAKHIGDAVPYGTVRECLDAVVAGEIEGAFTNLYSAEYLSQFSKYKNLHIIPQTGKTVDFSIGIRKPVNPMLVSILNKTLTTLSVSELETIIYQNSIVSNEQVTLDIFIQQNPYLSLGMLSLLFVVIVAAALLVLHQRIRSSKRLDVEMQRYLKLSAIANEYIYEYDCRKDAFAFSAEFAELFALPQVIIGFSACAHTLPACVTQVLQNIVQEESKHECDYLCTLPEGEQRWYRSTRAEVRDADERLIYIIGKLTDIQSEVEERTLLEQRAMLDGLTGIYNSSAVRDVIDTRLGSLHQTGALLMLDIDFFKAVNDQLGHFVGDTVIKECATLVALSAGKKGIAGRIGGDEFILFTEAADSMETLEKLCDNLCRNAKRTYGNDEGNSLTISISIGGALVRQSCSFEDLYQAADKALYQSKHDGKDRYTVVELTDTQL